MKASPKILIAAVFSLAFHSASAQQPAEEAPAALVTVESVTAEMIADQIWLPGTVVSRTDSNIAAEVAGRINWLADVGDTIKQGDVLAQLDDQLFVARVLEMSKNARGCRARCVLRL